MATAKFKASGLGDFLRGLALPALLIGIWQYLSTLGPGYTYAFVPLGTISRSLIELVGSGELFLHIGASLATALKSLLIGGTIGVLTGSLMAFSRPVDFMLAPIYHALRQVPA